MLKTSGNISLRIQCLQKGTKGRATSSQMKPIDTSRPHLEGEGSTLLLLVTTKLKVLASLERHVRAVLAGCALESEDDLLGRLGLLVEDRLGLTTVTLLLSVVTALSLSEEGGLTSLVLSDLVWAVYDGMREKKECQHCCCSGRWQKCQSEQGQDIHSGAIHGALHSRMLPCVRHCCLPCHWGVQ